MGIGHCADIGTAANEHDVKAVFALLHEEETDVYAADLVAMFDQRSEDYALLPVTPDVVAQHQQVADVFVRIGVLDGPANVAPLWDTSFNALLASA